MKLRIKLLERIYTLSLISLFLFIVFTPYLIKSGISLFEEELVEVITIIFLFGVGYIVFLLYRKEVAKNLEKLARSKQQKRSLEQQLAEAFKYIGSLNIQVREIRAVFSDIRKFPESKKDVKYILQFLSDRALSIVNVDWVMLRIIDTQALNTLGECCQTRTSAVILKHRIANRELMSAKNMLDLAITATVQENFNVKTFCIMPKIELSQEQKIFLMALVNQLEMLFVIFTSLHYKNSRLKPIGQTHQWAENIPLGSAILSQKSRTQKDEITNA
jgi:hypothetical protein